MKNVFLLSLLLVASFYPPIIAAHRSEPIIEELGGDYWAKQNLEKLLAGRIDAVYERKQYTTAYEAIETGMEERITIRPLPADPIPHYCVFYRNSPKAPGLLATYERAVEGMAFTYDAKVKEELAALRASKRADRKTATEH